jgi:hypothetical protein
MDIDVSLWRSIPKEKAEIIQIFVVGWILAR